MIIQFNISRDSLYFDTRPLDYTVHFYSYFGPYYFSCILPPHSFAFQHVFTLHLYISLMWNILNSLIPGDAVDQ